MNCRQQPCCPLETPEGLLESLSQSPLPSHPPESFPPKTHCPTGPWRPVVSTLSPSSLRGQRTRALVRDRDGRGPQCSSQAVLAVSRLLRPPACTLPLLGICMSPLAFTLLEAALVCAVGCGRGWGLGLRRIVAVDDTGFQSSRHSL